MNPLSFFANRPDLCVEQRLDFHRWITSQTRAKGERDYLFTERVVRFEPRPEDTVVLSGAVTVHRKGKRVELRDGVSGVTIELGQVSEAEAGRIMKAMDGRRCLLEVMWEAGVERPRFEQFLRATFGRVVFAPQAVTRLEERVPAVEVQRFPASPYEVDRAYWSNMAQVREAIGSTLDAVHGPEAFVHALRTLHIVALTGADGAQYYKPSSPGSDLGAQPGQLYTDAPVVQPGVRDMVFVKGPRVNVSLLGSPWYYQLLCESVGDTGALDARREFADQGLEPGSRVSWGRYLSARGRGDDQPRAWFCPPRPIGMEHWERLFTYYATARDLAKSDGDEHGEGPRRAALVRALARFHQGFVRLHPFRCANQSVAMCLANDLLARAMGKGVPHLLLDHLALRLTAEAYEQVVARAVEAYGDNGLTGVERLYALVATKDRYYGLLNKLRQAGSRDQARELVALDPVGAKAALLAEAGGAHG